MQLFLSLPQRGGRTQNSRTCFFCFTIYAYPLREYIVFFRAQKLYINDVILHVSFCRLLFIVLQDYGFEICPLSQHLEIGCINFNYSVTFQKFILLQLIFYVLTDGQLMFVWSIVLFPTFCFLSGKINILIHVS